VTWRELAEAMEIVGPLRSKLVRFVGRGKSGWSGKLIRSING
jgi:hypothetical protein